MIKLMLIAGAGGFIGTCFRFLINKAVTSVAPTELPLATFSINVIGCFLFGLISAILQKNQDLTLTPMENALLLTGFCGGLTTFSTFINEIMVSNDKGAFIQSAFYIAASIFVGLVALWLGKSLIK